MNSPHNIDTVDTGNIAIPMLLSFVFVLALVTLIDVGRGGIANSVQATSTATTTVTVLNTPPLWTVLAYELYESSTANPTNSGTSTYWTATATDSNGENWYLLICKSSSTPQAGTSTAPSCGGGAADRWAVSGATLSGNAAIISTTTTESFIENNSWYAYICDGNAVAPRCNGMMWDGDGSATSSPFVVNHRPTITSATDTSPIDPGAQVDWNTIAADSDSYGGNDTIQLHVCRDQDFTTSVPSCGVGGFWASSTFVVNNPGATTSIPVPTQDGDYDSYIYIVDEHGHASVSAWQSSSTLLTVSNVAPYVASSTITVYDVFGSTTVDTTLALTVEEGQTQNYVVTFDVTDENGCQNTAAGNEITGADINVFRSGAGGTYGLGCDASGEYDANDCYTHTSSNWVPTCYQTAPSCTANDWNNISWECTFPLWYIADPTDVGSFYAGDDWRASARATDDNFVTGIYSTQDSASDTAAQMTQFLSFRATGSPIAYGSFEPGFGNPTHPATTTVYATGNTGLDHYLSGDPMCPTYPTCSGNATSTIYVPFQHYATSSSGLAYASGFELSTSTSPVLVGVDILKTTSTSSPANDDTYWGIFVPSSITLAGDYIGRNYIDAAIAPSSDW